MNDSKIVHIFYTVAMTVFFNFFLFQTLWYFNTPKEIAAVICATLSAISIILSIFYTKASISISLMLNSIIMALYIAFLYWHHFTSAYKFFMALGLLIILIYSLHKILKNQK